MPDKSAAFAALSERDLEPAPLARAWTLPARLYTDPRLFDLELEAVFAGSWQLAGESQSLASPGDYRVDAIVGAPVILVRGKDRVLRAFYNVCRHRAGPVAAGSGNCKMLRCRYHGWVYQLDGRLHTAPEIGDVEDFDAADFALSSLALEQAGPLVFVARRANARLGTHTLNEVFGEISRRIGRLDFSGLTFFRRDTYDIACNWKVYVDNYLEGYHLPLVHPELSKILDYRGYATETFDGYSLQTSDIETPTAAYAAGDAFYYFLFPNIMLNILPGRLQTNVVIPLGPDRCRVIFDYYYEDAASDEARSRIEEDIRFGDLVQAQDINICEQVQQGLASGVYDRGRLSASREQGVHHFQEMLKAALRGHA